MKKIFVVIIGIVAISNGTFAQTKKTDWEKNGLKGTVKSVSISHYKAIDKFGIIGKVEKLNTDTIEGVLFQKYNNKGCKIEEIECRNYYSKGVIIKVHTYNYFDNKQNIIERRVYNPDGSLNYHEIYKYDDNNNMVEANSYKADKLSIKVILKYDTKNNLIEESEYNPDGSLYSKSFYQYDNKGNRIEKSTYGANGDIESKNVFIYDNNNNLIGEKEENYYSKYKSSYEYSYIYDLKGNKIIEMYSSKYSTRNYNTIKTYEYDEKNRLIEYCDGNDNIEFFKYDNQGNWIEKIKSKGKAKIPMTITERTIEYYE